MPTQLAPAWYIRTRAEFFDVLDRTIEAARRRAASSPLWTDNSIEAQLRAMAEWTAAGRTPTLEERDRIHIGLIAIREFDPEPEGEDADYIECLIQLAGYFDEWPDDPAPAAGSARASGALSAGLKLLLERRIGLLSSALHLAPGAATEGALRAALSANAEHVRLPGLADDLNPLVLDSARVEAFIEGLVRQPETVLRRLESRWLAIGVEGLYLAASSPVTAATIASGFELVLADEDGSVVHAQMRVSLRQDDAQAVATRARTALARFEAEVATLEANAAGTFVLMQAKWRRFAAASVWRIACRALLDISRSFRSEARRAEQAVANYVTPPWVGLPPR